MLVVFDGVCNFCSGWVRFVIAHDRRRVFRFAAAQTAEGGEAMAAAGVSADRLETIVLHDGKSYFTRSEAVLEILGQLGGWPAALAAILQMVPTALLDRCYEAFARRRYKLFGLRATCMLPEAAGSERVHESESGLSASVLARIEAMIDRGQVCSEPESLSATDRMLAAMGRANPRASDPGALPLTQTAPPQAPAEGRREQAVSWLELPSLPELLEARRRLVQQDRSRRLLETANRTPER